MTMNPIKGASFACILPFVELDVGTTGTASPCCNIRGLITSGDRVMSVYEDSVEDIWNSSHLRTIRQKMHAGEKLSECEQCFNDEAANGHSLRTQNNDAWEQGYLNANKTPLNQVMFRASHNDYEVKDGPERLLLKVGNLCNLKCRMCDGNSSSSIAHDAIQSKWTVTHIQYPRWVGRSMIIGPDLFSGTTLGGDFLSRIQDDYYSKLINGSLGAATIRQSAFIHALNSPEVSSVAIDLQAESADETRITVSVDEFVMKQGTVGEGVQKLSLPLPEDFRSRESLTISIETDRPLIINKISLERQSSKRSEYIGGNILSGSAWYRDQDFIESQLFTASTSLRQISLMGGEPTLIKSVRAMLRSLIKSKKSQTMNLAITTNATRCDDEWLELLASFQSVTIALSIDGHGELNSYIRSGASWGDIKNSIHSYKKLTNVFLYCHMTLQAYNMMHVAELAEFCVSEAIDLRFYKLEYPEMLGILAMPRQARELASAKLSRYIFRKDSPNFTLTAIGGQLLSIREALDSPIETNNPQVIENFKRYTSDLDSDRGQSFISVNGELASLLAAV